MTDTLAQYAARYAADGYQVFPLKPDKTPYTQHGMKDATADAEQVAAWWTQWPDALIGCRIPEGIAVLDIDPHSGGLDCWQALLDNHQDDRPEIGRMHFSGRGNGGFHAWFQHPGGKLSHKRLTGIDILHHGHRYTILPPSPHAATGEPYYWGTEGEPGPMPAWLAELLEPEAVAPRPEPRAYNGESVADWFSVRTSWVDILSPHGWHIVAGDGDSDGSKWRHPTATNAFSATISHGCLFVYTPNTVFEVTESDSPVGYTRFRAWSVLEHGDDMKSAARAAAQMPGAPRHQPAIEWPDIIASHRERQNTPGGDDVPPEDPESSDEQTNPLGRWLIDWSEFWRTDHKASDFLCAPILARGRGHALYAKAKTGKSLLVLEMAVSVATGTAFLHQPAGEPRHVLYVDYEMTPDDLYERLQAFGFGEGDDLSHLHYVQLPALAPLDTPQGGLAVLQAAIAVDAELVVIDTTARSVQGEENAMETFRDAYRHTFGPLKAAGITTLRVDHAGKDETLGQRGSSAKNDDVDVVWQLTSKGDGELTLKATHRRMGWIPEQVPITRNVDGDQMHTTTEPTPSAAIYFAGTKELAERLDQARVPIGMSRRLVREKYPDLKFSTALFGHAQQWRREQRNTTSCKTDHPTDHPLAVRNGPPDGPPRTTCKTAGQSTRTTKRTTSDHPSEVKTDQSGYVVPGRSDDPEPDPDDEWNKDLYE